MRKLFLLCCTVLAIQGMAQAPSTLGDTKEMQQFYPLTMGSTVKSSILNSMEYQYARDTEGNAYGLYVMKPLNKAIILKQNAIGWEIAFKELALPFSTFSLNLALDRNNRPYITVLEMNSAQTPLKLWVYFYDGNNWQVAGNQPVSGNDTLYGIFSNLVFDKLNRGFIFYQSVHTYTNIKMLQNNVWTSSLASYTHTSQLYEQGSMAADTSGNPYCLFTEAQQPHILKLVGTNWVLQPQGLPNTLYLRYEGRLHSDKTNKLYLAATRDAAGNLNDSGLAVYVSNGAVWSKLGGNLMEGLFLDYFSLHSDSINRLVVYGAEYGNAIGKVFRWNGNAWENLPDIPAGTPARQAFVAMGLNDTLYYFYVNKFTDKPDALKLHGNAWITATKAPLTAGLSAGAIGSIYGVVHPLNQMYYVIYTDQTKGGGLTCKRFNHFQGIWQTQGAEGFTVVPIERPTLKFSKLGKAYTICRDMILNGRATVYEYDGSTWLPLGPRGFSNGPISSADVFCDSSNNVYAAVSDSSNGYRLSVFRYNGTNWTQQSAGLPSGGSVQDIRVSSNVLKNPVIVYTDSAKQVRATFFNGTSWQSLGNNQISSPNASSIDVAKNDSSGSLYVLYKNNNNGQLMLKALNPTTNEWLQVGAAVSTDSVGGGGSIGLDRAGTPHVLFSDPTQLNKSTLMKFDTAWKVLGNRGFSPGNMTQMPNLTFHPNGSMYLAYPNSQAFARGVLVQTPVGLSKANLIELPQLRIYPNPSAERILDMQVAISDIGKTYHVYDITGKVWFTGTVQLQSDRLNLEGVPSGLYLIKIEQSTAVYKLVLK